MSHLTEITTSCVRIVPEYFECEYNWDTFSFQEIWMIIPRENKHGPVYMHQHEHLTTIYLKRKDCPGGTKLSIYRALL